MSSVITLPIRLSARILSLLRGLVLHGPSFVVNDLPAYLDLINSFNGVGLDDRKFLLEKILTVLSRAPEDSALAREFEGLVIRLLWRDLPHPPLGYFFIPDGVPAPIPESTSSNTRRYAFRSADGSNYNVHMPTLGMAGMPYVRNVPSTSGTLNKSLPKAEAIFDELLKRDDFTEHPGGLSGLFFAFANVVIHTIYNTNYADWMVNDASSYVDLSPLYGSSQAEVDSVRRKDGTGRLWEDVFADKRLLFMTPATCALLVLFCRNHNYVAGRIYTENEFRTFREPVMLNDKERAMQDDEIFHRARLVNSAFFAQIVLGDYVGGILGLTRDGLSWRLKLLESMRDINRAWTPQGEGNVISVEFNLMYRWHATSSQDDTKWMDKFFSNLFHGKPNDQITINDFKEAARGVMSKTPKDVRKRSFNELKRGPDGRFSDEELAQILFDATEAPAAAFKARGIPESLRIIEIMGITQSRKWGTCSLNEFRRYLGLKPYKDFDEWNPDPKVYTAAKRLYGDIENLELYVGMQAEEAKVAMPGAGLCPGFTISRAILADAIALTRGDRFLTLDFTPFNLTSWGYNDCMYDKRDGSIGGIMGRMLARTLPGYYPAHSAYTAFPFIVPQTMKGYMGKLPDRDVNEYDWERPRGPAHGKKAALELLKAKINGNGAGMM
ncbi:heme peroxidase [Rhodofomes roseus]|uniref:Heme peroxidase n=1 Tax=Rhodofomes roseus TaxID=34475 RepID=A0ABQ8KUC5_9APHY|nr:heme peroxidase [Rhodofomes roseus]KAH9842416.1 heme peroxidase [Rhodofomes roseus]